jgi:hypothetical protein
MDLRETGWDADDWIYVSQDTSQGKSLVNTVHKVFGNSCVAERLAASQEGLISMELIS